MSEAERKHGPLVPGKKTYPVSELQKMVWEVLVIFPSYDQKTALEVKQRTNWGRGGRWRGRGYNERTVCLRFAGWSTVAGYRHKIMTCTFYLDLIFRYLVLQCSTRCYRELHGVTWWYMVLHGVDIVLEGVTQGYIVLHSVTRCWLSVTGFYTVLQGVSRCYMVLHGVVIASEGVVRCHTVLDGVTRCWHSVTGC